MSGAKRAALFLMAAAYVFAGVSHFTVTDEFVKMMPPYLPLHREAVLVSGVAEIALGLAVLVPRLRRWAAWGLVALLVSVFPANVHVALHDIPLFGAEHGAGALNWARLPVQALLIAWAWWYTREP